MSARGRKLACGRPRIKRYAHDRHLIVCGGKVTEPEYFNFLFEELGIRGSVRVKALEGKDPLSLVRGAAKLRDTENRESLSEGAQALKEVWAVTDVDQFSNLAEAQTEAKRAGVKLVITNPCFEVWLIDHLKVCPESCAHTESCQSLAEKAGVIKSTDPSRKSKVRLKSVARDMLRGKIGDALSNSDAHNTDVKAKIRKHSPGNVEAYRVWTDVPEIVRAIRPRAS